MTSQQHRLAQQHAAAAVAALGRRRWSTAQTESAEGAIVTDGLAW